MGLDFMTWDWPAVLCPADEALGNTVQYIYGKPAENLVSDVYAELNMGGDDFGKHHSAIHRRWSN